MKGHRKRFETVESGSGFAEERYSRKGEKGGTEKGKKERKKGEVETKGKN